MSSRHAKAKERFFWENMYADIHLWVQSCPACAGKKAAKRIWGQLQPIQVSHAFQMVGVDVLGPLPATPRGATHIVVFSEYLTKWVEVGTTKGTPTAISIAELLLELVISRHGAPENLLSDSQFLSKMMMELYRLLGINKRSTTAYHPQCDGLVERFNRTLTQMLSLVIDKSNADWDSKIPHVLFAYRTSKHKATERTPFEMLYGRQARIPAEISMTADVAPIESTEQYAKQLVTSILSVHNEVKGTLDQVAER